ncbi:hypothetical protein Tco_0751145 [Tanacetum coccineum]|uniref:Uncharacterized protein n=1 Tax=Tanacetum coccineum TaxID=301880 RepID=A0ABQ4Z382_9ASTR
MSFCTTQIGALDTVSRPERLRKLRPAEAWATIERLAQYEDEGWNDAFIPVEMSLNYENPNIEQLLGIMKRKVDTLMKDAISLMGRSERRKSQAARRIYESDYQRFYATLFGSHKENNEQKTKEHKREILLSSRGAPSIRETLLIGSSFPAKTSNKHSLTPSMPTLSPGLNEEIFSVLMSSSIESWSILKESHLLMEFWPTIGDGGFNVGNTKVASIRDPRVKLAHRCIATTIAGRKETTHRVTEIDLYYLYCIYTPEVACNIPYWLSKYLKGVRTELIYGRVLLVNRIVGRLGVDWRGCVFGLQHELWRKRKKKAGGDAGHGGVGGFADIYRNMSQRDWQPAMTRSPWMYDLQCPHFQYLSTRDNLNPHLQSDPFLRKGPLLEDEANPKVYEYLMRFFGNLDDHLEDKEISRRLGGFIWRRNGQDYDSTPRTMKNYSSEPGDGLATIKQRRHDILVTAVMRFSDVVRLLDSIKGGSRTFNVLTGTSGV